MCDTESTRKQGRNIKVLKKESKYKNKLEKGMNNVDYSCAEKNKFKSL